MMVSNMFINNSDTLSRATYNDINKSYYVHIFKEASNTMEQSVTLKPKIMGLLGLDKTSKTTESS